MKLSLLIFILAFFFQITSNSNNLGAPEPKGKIVEFKSERNVPSTTLRGILRIPENSNNKSVPVVLMIWGSTCDNGTGWVPASDTASGRDETIFTDIAENFIRNGIAVFTYTKRGCNPLDGGTLDRKVKARWSRDILFADATAAFEAMIALPEIDSKRAFIFGYSEGNTYAWELGLKKGNSIRGLLLLSFISGSYLIAEHFQVVTSCIDAFDLIDERHQNYITVDDINKFECFAKKDYLSFETCDLSRDKKLTRAELIACRERKFLEHLNAIETASPGTLIPDSNDSAELFRQHFHSKSMMETADTQKVPVALFQGEADTATPVSEALMLNQKLIEINKAPFFFKTYKGLSHGLAIGKGLKNHCQKFGPVDKQVLEDIIKAIKLKL